jgi:radical SAM superfamily enzyme YgiQ (UPF0313 family)
MTKQIDLLLVSPGGRREVYQDLAEDLTAIEPPVWAGLIAEYVRRKGFSVEILDANAEGLDAGDAGKVAADRKPRLTAVVCYGQNPSASTQTMPEAYRISYSAKAWDEATKVVMVGGHVAALPDRTLRESGADYVCTGEGCTSIAELLQGRNHHDVRGIGFYGPSPFAARTYFETTSAPNVTDVNADMPAMHGIESYGKYRCHNWHGWTSPTWDVAHRLEYFAQDAGGITYKGNKATRTRSPYAAIYTSLGCPFACSFCCIQSPFKEGEKVALKLAGKFKPGAEVPNSYRTWSPEHVGQQIAKLHYDHGVGNIKIADEMFVLNKRHVEGVCDAIMQRIKDPAEVLNVWAYARVDTANDRGLLERMRRAGFRWLALGIESAATNVRAGVDKDYKGGDDQIRQCVDRIQAAGIHVLANYIFGLPEDDHTSMDQTLKLATMLNTPWANFYSAMPYPGSALWKQTPSHHGLEWSAFSQHSRDCTPMATKHLTSGQVLRFRDYAHNFYFSRPEYLALVEREFGTDAKAQVEAMNGKRLQRNLLEGNGDGTSDVLHPDTGTRSAVGGAV